MVKLSNWYKMWVMLSIALQTDQELEGSVPLKRRKDIWPKYAAIPSGCKLFEFPVIFKDDTGTKKTITIRIVSSNEKNAKIKYEKLIVELRAWKGEQKDLSSIIKNYNKYCAPLKIS